jgi:hypothetical protein
MAARTRRWQIILGVFVVSLYGAVLAHNLNESDRRSLDVKEVSGASDHVAISMHVVAASPRTSDITARLSFRLQGSIAKDPVTPAVDLTLFLNDIRGPQAIVWPRGRRINPIEASFSLTGNENMYPVDYYESEIRVGVSSIRRVASAGQWATPPQQSQKAGAVAGIDGALVLAAEDEGQLVPLAFSIAASIPGLKFEGKRTGAGKAGFVGYNLFVRRADNVIIVSVLIMVLMMCLAMSVLMMAIGSALGDKMELVPLSLSVSLLFGLPALRNAQPGVPALGALGDYVAFLWAECVVAVSAVGIIWIWLTRRRHPG